MATGECTAIISYRVNAEDVDKFLNAWDEANTFLKEQSGFISNTLHQAVSANPHLRFVNVARWDSDDSFRAATRSSGFSEATGPLSPYPLHASVYEAVRS